MLKELRIAAALMLAFTLLLGVFYPLATTGLAGLLAPFQAEGSLIEKDGQVVGSALIGQEFKASRYFHARPSYAGKGYAADNSGGANLGPTSKELVTAVRRRAGVLHKENRGAPVPIDLVTASASGLDPDISPAAAFFQAGRVAAARRLTLITVERLVAQHVDRPFLGIIGEPHVNVLRLNLALDSLQSPVKSANKAHTP